MRLRNIAEILHRTSDSNIANANIIRVSRSFNENHSLENKSHFTNIYIKVKLIGRVIKLQVVSINV